MEKANVEIREMCRERNIPLWLLAEKLGISDQTLYRRMRHQLVGAEYEKAIQAIEAISVELKTASAV